ncbi:MAG: glycosyltransferase family 2 protein [Cyanobacteria bacterium SZAS TMP-1]|nr:glycosyltransferase family 2 protein [Cyanobacteria bacterium SZAS TMP-1]
MRNRIVLFGVIVLLWIALKAIDHLVTGPEILIILSIALSMMAAHSVWLYMAQTRRRREGRLMHCGDLAAQAAAEWHPDVDIFISAKNESRVIETTVRNLFKLDYDRFLVWVIDDCSTDSMPVILDRLKDEYPNLRVINRKPGCCPGKSAALNEALALAKGDVVTVFDADAYVAPDFLKTALPHLQPETVGAVQAQKRMFEHQKGFLVHCQDSEYAMDTYFQVSRDLIGGAVELRGNGQLVKRQALIDVGGWNNKAITDDLDLSMRLLVNNWDIRFSPEAVVWEEAVGNLKGLIRQRRRWAEGSMRRYLDYIFPLNSPTRLSLVERLDTLVFTVYFLVPALMLLEVTSEVVHLLSGVPTYGKFLAIVAMGIFLTTQVNQMIARNFYRNKVSFLRSFVETFLVTAYIYMHWVPVIVFSISKILFGKQVSTWHRTEHTGVAFRA